MIAGAALTAFAATADLDRSHAFYGGVLRLERTEASGFANAYDVNGTQLRLTLVEHVARAPYTVLGWSVPDVAAAIAELDVDLLRYEGLDQDDVGVWTAPSGTQVAWFQDPDGNVLSLSQR